MAMKHSRRILAVGSSECGVLDMIRALTGTAPEADKNCTFAGLSHEWIVKTAYYSAKVPMWVDELIDIEEWKAEFLKQEAKEVVEAVGAWIYCFRQATDGTISADMEKTMRAIQCVIEEHIGYAAEIVMLAVAMPHESGPEQVGKDEQDQLEDMCIQCGFEYIEFSAQGKNEYGEKVGFERFKEALEANEWTANAAQDDDVDLADLDFDAEDKVDGFGREEAEMTAELFGMKAALSGGEDSDRENEDFMSPTQQAVQVDNLDRMMGKILAIKEQNADLPEAQRKRMAARAVRELTNDNSAIG